MKQPRTAGEPGLEQLGAQVMVVEHEPGPVQTAEHQGDGPEDVRRVAGLDDREPALAAGLERLPGGGRERVGVLGDEADLAAARRVGAVLVQLHPVDDLVGRVSAGFRADRGHPVAGREQRLALEPDPAVEGQREILHDDQDARLMHPY